MARTRSASLAKGKTKLYQPPMRVSPWLAALQCKDPVQPQTQTPDIPAEEIVKSILPPKKCLNYKMAGKAPPGRTPRPRVGDLAGSLHCTVSEKRWSSKSVMTRCNKRIQTWSKMPNQKIKLKRSLVNGTLTSYFKTGAELSQTWVLLDMTKDHLQQQSRQGTTLHLHRGPCNFQ
ncbi:hypothetical protein PIB30_090598, partial [Stylosanthes scabra]|nr:hypothetical protein [Stylosanthes scabra]